MKNNNIVKKICILALSISFLLNNLVYAKAAIIWAGQGGDTTPPIAMTGMATTVINQTQPIANVVGNAATINSGTEETIILTDFYEEYGDSGLTKSQATSMTFRQGAEYMLQRYTNTNETIQTAGRIFSSLWRQILKEEFPEALSNGLSSEGLTWILSGGCGYDADAIICSLTASEYDSDGRFFMQKKQKPTQKCETFVKYREYVKDCDRILREKGYY